MKRYFEVSQRKPWLYAVMASIFLLAITVGTVAAHPRVINGTLTYLNMQRVHNTHNYRTVIKGHVQLNRVGPWTATLDNEAIALASCNQCNTFVEAFQINVISLSAKGDTSINASIAVNDKCTGCYTASWAGQWDVYTTDWWRVSDKLSDAVSHMNREIDQLEDSHNMSPSQIAAKMDAINAEFTALMTSTSAAAAPHTAAPTAPGSANQPHAVLSTHKATSTVYSG